MKKKKPFLFALVYGTLLAGFTGYVMLDTFVIPTVESKNAGAANYSLFEGIEAEPLTPQSESTDSSGDSSRAEKAQSDTDASSSSQSSSKSKGGRSRRSSSQTAQAGTSKQEKSSSEAASESTPQSSDLETPGSYSDENISISLSTSYLLDTVIYTADIQLSSAQYLKTAFADNSYGKNVTAPTSETAAANNAILAINGDYYGARERGYVIRNGVLYRETGSTDTDVLCIYADGHFEITNAAEKTSQQLIDEGVWQAFSFGPALLENGEVAVTADEEVGRAMASNPRTAIGIIDDLHYVFVVSDGRTEESEGLSLSELANYMKSLGVKTAYNLDGGGSSTMYYNGEVINKPTTSGRSTKERSVSDIVYIGY